MKKKMEEKIGIPEGVSCNYESPVLTCTKDSVSVSKVFDAPEISVSVSNNELVFTCLKGNKKKYKILKSFIAHAIGVFQGLSAPFVYDLESCNVHFPMSVKKEGDVVLITNFLGEKKPRISKILPNVEVKIEGHKITVSSRDKAAAGQTAANLEFATRITKRDRRIFQDGIFLTSKPGAKHRG